MQITSNAISTFEKKHQALVRAGAPESMVLLKNDQILPLTGVRTIALYGSGARTTIKGGTGSGDVNVRHFTTVEEGLQNAGITITTGNWLTQYSELKQKVSDDFFSKLMTKAKADGGNLMLALMGKTPLEPDYDFPLSGTGDAAVYVLARNSGEGSDRRVVAGDIKLTETERRDIKTLAKQYQQFVLVLNVGGVVDISEVAEDVPAILLMSQLGMETGSALADVLLGKTYPSGKLTATWAPIEDYRTTQNFGDPHDTEYKEGIYVGYRYFDRVGQSPTYPFGFGLGYTTFSMSTQDVRLVQDRVELTVTVKNTGNCAGKEVVQVYYSAPETTLDMPYQELATYAKTPELAAGEATTLTLQFPVKRMASYLTAKAQMVLQPGGYWLRVGNSSRQTKIVAQLQLNQQVVVQQLKHVGGSTGFTDFVSDVPPYSYTTEAAEKKSAPILIIDGASLKTKRVVYSNAKVVPLPAGKRLPWSAVKADHSQLSAFVAGLSATELTRLLIGNYSDTVKGDAPSIIGNAGSSVAGSAGETTHAIADLGLPVLVMADGPAGLRLSPMYTRLPDGTIRALSSSFVGMPGAETTDDVTAPATVFYQYCTAIPIGTAIAQSWNTDLARKYGDLVGEEMVIFGVDIWLAPALNIQRSPLDGRDFEYYSEDPLIAGEMAAAVTLGVQSHPGKATTIKHFVANNQETNRQASNSVINERALREIYLKGFEIAVKTAQPHTIMSSYNLLNGVHVPNRFDIMTSVLRDEWGFQGFAMTDWFTTGGMGEENDPQRPNTSAPGEVIAGNDLTMPGLPSDAEAILNALDGKDAQYPLHIGQLQLAALRILRVILKLSEARA